MDRIKIGIITKPQALKGAFRVKPEFSNLKLFKKLNSIIIDNTIYPIESVTLRDTFVILKCVGVDTPESAEALRNKEVFGDVDLPESMTNNYKDWNVVVGDLTGKVIDVNNYGSKDIFTLKLNRSCMLPVIDNLILKTDENSKTIYLNQEIFEQVVVYED